MDNNHLTSPNPTPQPVPTQWCFTRDDEAPMGPTEASHAAESMGLHVHDADALPIYLGDDTWLLDTPYVVVAKLATEGRVESEHQGYSAEAEWPDHVPVPDPVFSNPTDALRHHVSGAVDRGEAEPIVEVGVDDAEPACEWRVAGDPEVDDPAEDEARCPACGWPISYCQGHGEIGDPSGFAVLQCHDRGDHASCHPDGCEFLDLLQATIEDDGVQGVAALLATPPQVWVVEQVTHGDHEPDDSGESCTDECVGELALATWYPSQIRACYVADELQRQTFTSHRASLLVLDPENPSLPM